MKVKTNLKAGSRQCWEKCRTAVGDECRKLGLGAEDCLAKQNKCYENCVGSS